VKEALPSCLPVFEVTLHTIFYLFAVAALWVLMWLPMPARTKACMDPCHKVFAYVWRHAAGRRHPLIGGGMQVPCLAADVVNVLLVIP